jgi:hypothetical protein
MQLYSEHCMLMSDVATQRMEIESMKNDFKTLIATLNKPFDTYGNSNMQSLKNRYQVY